MHRACSLCPREGGRDGKEGEDRGLGKRGLWGQVWLGTGCPKKDPRPRSFLGNYYFLMENFPDATNLGEDNRGTEGSSCPGHAMNEPCDVGQDSWLPNTHSGCLLDCSVHPLKMY